MLLDGTDTIAARATPPGEGAIAILRLSGQMAHTIVGQCFRPRYQSDVKYNYMTLGEIFDPADGSFIDEVFCVLFQKPHSYTGEDVVEIHCHGSPVIISRSLELFCRLGARLAEPGEFTLRAFLNSRLDLTRAEAVCDLIRSRTDKGARLALRQLQGSLLEKINGVKQKIIAISAELEARLDFPGEDVGEENRTDIIRTFENALQEIIALIEKGSRSRIFLDGARIVIAGPPNVGKSSLFNALLRIDRAIVTPHPGTTRDTIEATIDLKGCPATYVDSAGLREDAGEVEILGIERAKTEISCADLVLFLLDTSKPLAPDVTHIFDYLKNICFILVLNKIDLPECLSQDDIRDFSEMASKCVKVSALTNKGIDNLEEAIADFLLHDTSGDENALVVNERHLALLEGARNALTAARDAFQRHISDEMVMIDVREAHRLIARITGEEVDEEVLDLIFSKFCIGK
ncbi:MAG: tRNA uridine-5-carboxymethylaminomethyl(34) synthesis GTPase MnmE [Candidatus Sumerlaeota bacterium]|nr:tRNA uridine-5-carboxymethylaminomethyl(34) synthesis GTPase MnmE [Candidatus Sumerlaeota bacterium]